MSHFFGLEQIEAAVDTLAAGPERLQHRLAKAFLEHLTTLDPDKDLPAELRPRFLAIRLALLRFGDSGVAAQVATNMMTELEAVTLAQEIVALRRALSTRGKRR